MTIIERQRGESDCALCCISMATGVPYDEAVVKWGDEFVTKVLEKGTYGDDFVHAFGALGLVKDKDYVVRYLNLCDARLAFVRNILWGRRAMIQVRSKNVKDGFHMIYWDGKEIIDPSNKLCYTTMEEVEPTWMWIFNENKSR